MPKGYQPRGDAFFPNVSANYTSFGGEKTTTAHRHSINDDTKSRREGTYGHSNLPLYFSKAV